MFCKVIRTIIRLDSCDFYISFAFNWNRAWEQCRWELRWAAADFDFCSWGYSFQKGLLSLEVSYHILFRRLLHALSFHVHFFLLDWASAKFWRFQIITYLYGNGRKRHVLDVLVLEVFQLYLLCSVCTCKGEFNVCLGGLSFGLSQVLLW